MQIQLELQKIKRAIRAYWWIPLVLAIVFGSTIWMVSRNSADTYVARSHLLVTPNNSGAITIASQDNSTETFRQIVKSRPVLDAVIAELGLSLTPQELSQMVQTVRVPGTNIIEIQVRDNDPQVAADINNGIARQAEANIANLTLGQMQRNLDELTYQASVLRDRLTTIESQSETIVAESDPDDAEAQERLAEISQEKLQTQQTLADVESGIRDLRGEIAKTASPLAIIDTASVPDAPEGASPIVLTAMAIIASLGIGGLIGLWLEYRNDSLLSPLQVVSSPVIAELGKNDLMGSPSGNVALLAAKLAGASRDQSGLRLAVVSPRFDDRATVLQTLLANQSMTPFAEVIVANGVLEQADQMESLAGADKSLVVAFVNETTISDLDEMAHVTALVDTLPIGTVLVTNKTS